MSRVNNLKFLIIFIVSITSIFKSFGQLSNQDFLIIIELKAIRITDSINSPIPNNIRILTIEYLKKKNLKPDEYFTLGTFQPHTQRAHFDTEKNNQEVNAFELLRIGGLRDMYCCLHPGAAGSEGDDIWIVFDKEYKQVLTITGAE